MRVINAPHFPIPSTLAKKAQYKARRIKCEYCGARVKDTTLCPTCEEIAYPI